MVGKGQVKRQRGRIQTIVQCPARKGLPASFVSQCPGHRNIVSKNGKNEKRGVRQGDRNIPSRDMSQGNIDQYARYLKPSVQTRRSLAFHLHRDRLPV
jgi:hypothetical protein